MSVLTSIRYRLPKLVPSAIRPVLRSIWFRLYGMILYRRGARNSNRISYSASLATAGEDGGSRIEVSDLEAFFDAKTEGPGIWKWRHYFDIYDRHFRKFRGRPVRILEIGIYSGGSLEMWRHYFGHNCIVYGIDIENDCKVYENDQVKVYIGDQSDPNFWRRFKSEVAAVDIIIDDGGHLPNQQLVTLEETLSHLTPGGVYLCEDITGELNPFHAYLAGLSKSLHGLVWGENGVSANPFQRLVHSIHTYPYVCVIETNAKPVFKFEAPKHGTQWQPFFPQTRQVG
jgi:hypothetical protein